MHIEFWWERQRPLGRPRCRWKNNIIMDHKRHRMGWWLRKGAVMGTYEHGNKLSVSIQCWEILQRPSDRWLLKNSAPWSYCIRAHYCDYTRSSWLCILRQTNMVQTFRKYFFKIYLNSTFASALRHLLVVCFSQVFCSKLCMHFSL
jgi:hypothetical protein